LTKLLDYLFVVEFKQGCENKVVDALCHTPNLIPEFVTMTDMLISRLNLILTRTNLIFTKASLFLFILISLLFDITFFLLDIQSIYTVLKNNIIYQLFNIHTFT